MIQNKDFLKLLTEHLGSTLKSGSLPNEFGRFLWKDAWIIAYEDACHEELVEIICTRPSLREAFKEQVNLLLAAVEEAQIKQANHSTTHTP